MPPPAAKPQPGAGAADLPAPVPAQPAAKPAGLPGASGGGTPLPPPAATDQPTTPAAFPPVRGTTSAPGFPGAANTAPQPPVTVQTGSAPKFAPTGTPGFPGQPGQPGLSSFPGTTTVNVPFGANTPAKMSPYSTTTSQLYSTTTQSPYSTTVKPSMNSGMPQGPGQPAVPPTPAPWVRVERAVKVLERIGTPEAIQILQTLSQGEPEALPTKAAKEALERLNK